MRYRYYCPERPPMPGAIPKNGLIATGDEMCWPRDVFCWGWCEYNRKLTEEEMAEYELIWGEENEDTDTRS